MGLNNALRKQHIDLIDVINDQEEQAIQELRDKFSVVRLGVNQAFGIDEEATETTEVEITPMDSVVNSDQSAALGATS